MRGEEDEAEGIFLPINFLSDDGGKNQPANTKEDEAACNLQHASLDGQNDVGALLPSIGEDISNDGALRPTIGATHNSEVFPCIVAYLAS